VILTVAKVENHRVKWSQSSLVELRSLSLLVVERGYYSVDKSFKNGKNFNSYQWVLRSAEDQVWSSWTGSDIRCRCSLLSWVEWFGWMISIWFRVYNFYLHF
jgi:hypothetical protein